MPSNPLPDQSILVRVAPEILAHMKTGDVEPVVILGVQDIDNENLRHLWVMPKDWTAPVDMHEVRV